MSVVPAIARDLHDSPSVPPNTCSCWKNRKKRVKSPSPFFKVVWLAKKGTNQARKRHINFEHISLSKWQLTLGQLTKRKSLSHTPSLAMLFFGRIERVEPSGPPHAVMEISQCYSPRENRLDSPYLRRFGFSRWVAFGGDALSAVESSSNPTS